MQKFWRILKKILTLSAVLACVVLFVVVLTSAIKKHQALVCKSVLVKIDLDSGLAFLNNAEITERVNYLSGENVIGKPLAKIDFKTLEQELEKNPYVQNAEIFVDQQQQIQIDITQKRPILRILNSDGVSYYLGQNNERIPLSDNFTAYVTVATGKVELHKDAARDSSVQAALFSFINTVIKDEFLLALVNQIDVQENGDLDLIPKMGGHTIHFGNGEQNVEAKFKRLKTFYLEGLKKVGWDKYKSIDLRFDDQVVCVKRDIVVSALQDTTRLP